MEFRFRKGRDIDLGPGPSSGPAASRVARAVGLTARDFPGVTFDLRVAEGEKVRRGQPVCVSRHHPEIAFVASISGRVSQIQHGARRRIETVEVVAEGDNETTYAVDAAQSDDGALRRLLLESGDWAAFRTRPFGRIPDPSGRPSAIFVTATASTPLAPDPAQVLGPQLDSFRRGVLAMLRLTDGPVFVCQAPGPLLIEPGERLRVARFSGPHPSGLSGTHIHHLWPVSSARSVWQIGYQDVAAIGELLASGKIATHRTISVAGPDLGSPTLVRAPLGADIADLLGTGHPDDDIATARLISGPILTGRECRFLGRHDLEVTVLVANAQTRHAPSALGRLLGWLPRATPGATLPSEAFERLFPFDILPVPLMRALAVGDVETAERLGSLELVEEDMALLSWRCPSGSDYGTLLRRVLDTLDEKQVQ